MDDEGFLTITDRKKDLIVTAGGKNIAPQNIENLIRTLPLISQVMVHGDRRKYLTALITLNEQELRNFAKRENLVDMEPAGLADHPQNIAGRIRSGAGLSTVVWRHTNKSSALPSSRKILLKKRVN